MASRSTNPKARKTREDTWNERELTRELRRNRGSDGKVNSERGKDKQPDGKTRSQVKEREGRSRKSEKEGVQKPEERRQKRHGEERGGKPQDRTRDTVLKETQSPRTTRSPKPKDVTGEVTGSPSHRLKQRERVKLPDKNEYAGQSPSQIKRAEQIKGTKSGQKDSEKKRKERESKEKRKVESTEHDSSGRSLVAGEKQRKKSTLAAVESAIPMEEVVEDISHQDNPGIDDYGYSDDQFEEDYEEDFDEVLEDSSTDDHPPSDEEKTTVPTSELNDIMQAINSENMEIDQIVPQETPVHPSAPPLNTTLTPRPKMSFTSPPRNGGQMTKTSRKIRARAKELSNLIAIDVMAADMFELNPLTEYDFYMRSFGNSNTRQTGSQTGCDCDETETQTEEVVTSERWTQWPPHDMKGYGGSEEEESELCEEGPHVHYDSETLLKFMSKAGRVVETLLEEEEQGSGLQGENPSNQYNDNYCSLQLSFGTRGPFQCMDWRHAQPSMFLIGYGAEVGQWRGTLELWSLSRPSSPQYCLGNHSVSTSCCLLFPLVFSGNEDGSLVLWDLREPLSMHKSHDTSNDETVTLHRVPTYTTASLGWDSGHCEPILCLASTNDISTNEADWQVRGLSYQLLSVDSSGKGCVWVVVEVLDPDPAGSETDLGLVPGGKIKLIASSSFRVFDPSLVSPCILFLCVGDASSNALFVGTDNGDVLCHLRYKSRVSPRTYSLNSLSNVSQSITSVSIHPTSHHHFLVGYSTGHLALFHTNAPQPLVQWLPPSDLQVHSLHWHPGLISVFTGIWGDDLHIWDLLQNDAEPVHKIPVNDERLVSALPITGNATNSNPAIALCLSSGLVSIYQLKSSMFPNTKCQEQIEQYFSMLF